MVTLSSLSPFPLYLEFYSFILCNSYIVYNSYKFLTTLLAFLSSPFFDRKTTTGIKITKIQIEKMYKI